jgi:DNA-directed RNA polymerase specialized sigma24 family protein
MGGAYRREGPQPQTLSAAEYLPHLPTISRMVVVLRYLHQRTYEEIALVLSLPIRTIKIHLFGTRTFLKEQMQVHHLSALPARGCE